MHTLTKPVPSITTERRDINTPLNQADAYLHVKIRGFGDQPVFIEPADYHYFEFLLEHNLTDHHQAREQHLGTFPDFHGDIELLCYSLLENRLYLLIHQITARVVEQFLEAVLKRYTRYFCLKYEQHGPVFDPSKRVAPIKSQHEFDFVSRSIHLSPTNWRYYRYSSLHYYLEEATPVWLKVSEVLSGFTSSLAYLAFLKNYQNYRQVLKRADRV